jgi:hypothetical protein
MLHRLLRRKTSEDSINHIIDTIDENYQMLSKLERVKTIDEEVQIKSK